MGSICGYICKTTPRKCIMERVPVEVVCVRPKTELGHPTIYLPHTSMWWRSTGNRHRSKVFYCCRRGYRVLASRGIRGGTRKTGILHPGRKAEVEGDAYGGPKWGSNIFSNDDEATYLMGQTSQRTWFENIASKIIIDDVLLYRRTSKQLLDCFITVLDGLKHHHATLKLKKCKWIQDRWEFLGM